MNYDKLDVALGNLNVIALRLHYMHGLPAFAALIAQAAEDIQQWVIDLDSNSASPEEALDKMEKP